MFLQSFKNVLDKAFGKEIIVVGAGRYGRELVGALIDNNQNVNCFFDNDSSIQGLNIYGVQIEGPSKELVNSNTMLVISTGSDLNRFVLKRQLTNMGIAESQIICYYPFRCADYNASLQESDYKKAIDEMFMEKFGRKMNWDSPRTYNEKINWEKINNHDERRVTLADKSLARNWVAEKIGKEHITRHYGVWNHAEDIPFDELPEKFVLKANNGSGRNILVKDKNKLDIPRTKEQLDYWMTSNYMFNSFEMHYKDIKPRIIAEEYLDGLAESVYDYNIYCFHGEPKYIWCIKGSHRPRCTASFYDLDWNKQPFSYGYPPDIYPAPKPHNLDEMLELTRILCKDFDHVRVDWFDMPDGRILFGEMTFQTWAGLNHFIPEKYDLIFGEMI